MKGRKNILSIFILLVIICLIGSINFSQPKISTIQETNITLKVEAGPNPIFSETIANVYTTGSQWFPCISKLSDTTYVIVWRSDGQLGTEGEIYARIFDNTGASLTSEFLVNTYTTSYQDDPSVSCLNDTAFVVVWTSYGQDAASTYGVYGAIFDNTGTKLVSDFPINNVTASNQMFPSVCRLTDTTFAVVFAGYGQDAESWGIIGSIFDTSGKNITSEFILNTNQTGFQSRPTIDRLTDTTFAVAWTGPDVATSDYGIYANVFDNTGTNLTNEFRVNYNTTNVQDYACLSRLTDTTFTISWESDEQDGDQNGIFTKIFDTSGTNLTNEFQANTHTAYNQYRPTITELTDKTFLVAWTSDMQEASSSTGVYGRIFDDSGTNLTNEIHINSYTSDVQGLPSACMLNDTIFVVAWQSYYQDEDESGIYFRGFYYEDLLPQSNSPLNASYKANSTGHTIDWNLTDDIGSGNYTVLKNESTYIEWDSWDNDTNLQVPVDTNCGVGVWNYTIKFNDSNDNTGIPHTVFITIYDEIPTSNTPSASSYYANSTGNTIDWVLIDYEGTGNYTVLKNESTYIEWDSWDNDTNLQVPVDTNCGVGVWNYTIQFNDSNNNYGAPHMVWVTIMSHSPTCNSPDNATYQKHAENKKIEWIITDKVDSGGWYRVFINDQLYLNWSTWNNGTNLNIAIITDIAGTWVYVIQYNDSYDNYGMNDTVEIIITELPGGIAAPPIPGFELFTVFFVIIAIVGISYTLKKRNSYRFNH
ncbi:MAG: hypothetical protein EAX96_11375 [Candidatus Lokiarchaeota archaeon]|nr:hypothetical protein [Candidatus Lokiarchaeota archaeon]